VARFFALPLAEMGSGEGARSPPLAVPDEADADGVTRFAGPPLAPGRAWEEVGLLIWKTFTKSDMQIQNVRKLLKLSPNYSQNLSQMHLNEMD
jgi:hypothetical protein